MQEPKKPIGDFIINNSKGTQTENGVYYRYTEVCRLLKLYEKQLLIHKVVGQSEQLVCSCGSRLVKTTGGYHCGNAKCST